MIKNKNLIKKMIKGYKSKNKEDLEIVKEWDIVSPKWD